MLSNNLSQSGRRGLEWSGDLPFLLSNLILKDFRIRYRSMSLGVFWSLLNPLVNLGILWVVFSVFFRNDIPYFQVYLLCGLIPFNFISVALPTGVNSLLDNAALIKRVPVPREVVPVASVLANCIHLGIQLLLLVGSVFLAGLAVNVQWLWIPLLWSLEIVFICGFVMAAASVNVYIRDVKYLVDSGLAVLFWTVPIFYQESQVPSRFRSLYELNPVTALTLSLRQVIIHGQAPSAELLIRLVFVACASLIAGYLLFERLKTRFYDYL